jgi:methyl-accepting chemotaxis protein
VVREITSAAREQASGLSQVNIAVNQMDQMTQQNAAMVEETTAAGHALRHEAETLNDIVARFTVEPQRQASSAPAAIRMARRAGARG